MSELPFSELSSRELSSRESQTRNIEEINSDVFRLITFGCWGVYCQEGEHVLVKYKDGKFRQEKVVRGQQNVVSFLSTIVSQNNVKDLIFAGDNVYQYAVKEEDVKDYIHDKQQLINEGKDPKIFDMDKQIHEGFVNCFRNVNIDRYFLTIGNHDVENCEIQQKQLSYTGWKFPSLYYKTMWRYGNHLVNALFIDTNMFDEGQLQCDKTPYTDEMRFRQAQWMHQSLVPNAWNIIIGHIPILANGHKQKRPVVHNRQLYDLISSVVKHGKEINARVYLYICADEHNQQFIYDRELDIGLVIAGSGGTDLDALYGHVIDGTKYMKSTFGFVMLEFSDEMKIIFYSSIDKNISFSTKIKF